MDKQTITRDQVSAIYDEMDRRLAQLFHDGLTVAEYEEERASMMQGIYCALISVSSDWPTVADMCRIEEENRYFSDPE